MTEVVRWRDCCLSSLPNILEGSGLRTTNSEEPRNCEKVCIICLPLQKSLEKSGTGENTMYRNNPVTVLKGYSELESALAFFNVIV